MFCTYCQRDVSSPHRCESHVHKTAHTVYVSARRVNERTGSTIMSYDPGRSTIRNPKERE